MISACPSCSPIVFIDDAHTFGGAQIALAWAINVVLRGSDAQIVCVCTPKTRQAVSGLVGDHARLKFIECPSALPLNIFTFAPRIIPFLRIILRLRREGVRAWWLNLSGIEFCIAAQIVLKSLGEMSHSWLHNTESFSFFTRHGSRARRSISWIRDKVADHWVFGLHSHIVTPSHSTATEVVHRFRGPVCPDVGYLYYPTIGEVSLRGRARSHTEEWPKGPISLWMIGRIEYGHKNNVIALEVLERLRSMGEEASLTVVGDGPDMEAFVSRTRNSSSAAYVTLAGWQKDPWEGVPQDAMLIIPSLYESMSLVAREAMIRGLRLVASPIPVFREWIPARLIADGLDAEAFVQKIVEVQGMKRPELESLYEVALSRFSDAKFLSTFMEYTVTQRWNEPEL